MKILMKNFFYILLFANFIFADVIYFSNGDIDEGHVKLQGKNIMVTTKNKKGSYGIPTNSIKRIEKGIWLDDLDLSVRKVAENTRITKPIIADKAIRTINTVNNVLQKKFSFLSYKQSEKIPMQVIIICSICFILIIVSFVCRIVLWVDAFQFSIAWGLCSLFIPFVIWIYLFTNYTGNKGKMFLWLLSPILWLILSISIIKIPS